MPPRTRKPGKRRPRGEYATFDLHIEGLSAQAQALRTHSTFVDDIAGGDSEPKPLKPEVIAAREHEAKSYADHAKRLSDHRQEFISETMRQHQQRLEQASKVLKSVLEPQAPKPKYNQVHTASGLVLTAIGPAKPWRRM